MTGPNSMAATVSDNMTQVMASLRDVPNKLLTSKLKIRQQLFEDLNNVVALSGLTEPVLKGLCKLPAITIQRYRDSKSRSFISEFIKKLLKYHHGLAVKYLAANIVELSQGLKAGVTSKSSAQICLTGLTWSCIVVKSVLDKSESWENPAIKSLVCIFLVQAQHILVSGALAAESKSLNKKVRARLQYVWSCPSAVALYNANILQSVDQPSHHLVMFISQYLLWLNQVKKSTVINELKNAYIDIFLKSMVSGKVTKAPQYVLNNLKPLLRHVTHDDFKQQMLPSLQKAMLRSPETVLPCVAAVIQNLSIDLSQYATDIGKVLTSQLHSNSEECRLVAAEACGYLAKQCSDPQTISDLVQYMFAVLNGSEGKLTVVTQRIGIVNGIGKMSQHAVGGASLQDRSTMVCDHFVTILKQEVHEETLISALSNLSLWCQKLTSKVPKTLMEIFQTGPALKSSTSAVRNAYILCMGSAFHGNTIQDICEVLPFLTKTVEKVFAQSNLVAVLTEGLSAACLLLKAHRADVQMDKQFSGVLKNILDMQKLPFYGEKFIHQLSEEGLISLTTFTERILIDHFDSIKGDKNCIYLAILELLTSSSLKVRKNAQSFLRKTYTSFGDVFLAKQIFSVFCDFLQTHEIAYPNISESERENGNDTSYILRATLAVECLHIISFDLDVQNPELQSELKGLAHASLTPACHPVIDAIDSNMWTKILQNLGLNSKEFVENESDKLIDDIMLQTPSLAKNSIKCVVKLAPEATIPKFFSLASAILRSPELKNVTRNDFAILLTPEGELYDRSCIESVKEEVQNKNIKRESKLYSYKEQMAELALRKEIEEKRRAKGIKTEPQLTKKQQELMKIQLDKESAIRQNMKQLDDKLNQAEQVLVACFDGNSKYFSRFISDILPLLISNLSSPLCAPKLSALFIKMRTSVFPSDQEYLGLSIAYVTLRLLNPACDLEDAWIQEDLKHAISRVVSLLHKKTCPPIMNVEDYENALEPASMMSAPAFSYCFPLIKEVMKRKAVEFERDYIQALEIIDQHALMRRSTEELENPQLLPMKAMFQALIAVLAESSGKIQVMASKAIENVAICGSGKESCATANEEQLLLLLDSLLYSSSVVRESVLRCLQHLINVLVDMKKNTSFLVYLTRRIYILRFDAVEENKELSEQLWSVLKLKLDENLGMYILQDVCHPVEVIRQSSALALANYVKVYPALVNKMLQKLLEIYHSKLEMPAPILDNFGRMISEPPVDPWEPRGGVALSICKMAPHLTAEDVREVLGFLVPEGLGDRYDEVRREMLNAAVAVIDIHGKDQVSYMLPVFEDFLDKAPNTSSYDTVRQSVIILMGCLARHLDKTDPKVKPIIYKLIDALSTPSQQVQEAVSNCLPPLVPAVKDEAPAIVQKLLALLLDSDKYGERKGAAYGIAGLVKGLGILALKQLDIMSSLTTAIQNKKNHKHREGALFAFEMLCNMLGRLFEPYIVHVLPHLLLCFGDGNQYVREATDDTAKAVMSKLSAHGVKLVLPSLLTALEEDSWRTKTGSVELLGAMAYCAPKQLSSCLPNIVPKLIEVLSDSHIKVQKAGAQALKMIGSVIRNPEIQAIVDVLLEALQDPSKKTAVCLGILLNTKFVHFIDAPSLALIMPVVQRAFQDRSTETRKMAAQIIGNMYSLTDQKDLGPYLPTITPGLQQSLLDPVPEVRSVSARALGAMVKGMGESSFENLMPWLMQTLTSDRSSVDRSGAAQGLSEVIGGLGVDKLHKLMPEIISTSERNDIFPHVKDGYMMLFIYMPVVFPKEFTHYIGNIINPILKALADENEYVRDTALKAGQRIVNMYAESAIQLLLPQLEAGLFDENWRIRYSSVQLLGDLLYKISGVSGKMTTETANEDDNFGTEKSQKVILNILGPDRRNRVLAGLYMGRSDSALMVRQAALHVWKIIVTNTPRMLREILPTLFSLLLGCLASTSYDKRQVAARTLGDLVRKLGERVLPEIIPILERGLESDQPDQRQGVCIGLSEIMTSTSREMVLTFVDSLVPTVRKALCDPLPEVRQAAAKTFDSLHSTVGARALDDILPQLLEQLSNPDLSECTLDGLKNVMAIKSRVVLPYLVPQLTAEPVNTKALSFLSSVAGDALNKHLSKILPALLTALGSAIDTPAEQQEKEYCEKVVLSVQDDLGVRTVMDELMEATKSKERNVRRAAVSLLFAFCCQTRANYAQYVSQLIRGLIHLFVEDDVKVLQLSWDALNAVIKTLDATEQLQHVSTVRQAIRFVVSDSKEDLLPGFCLSKGITPLLPIFREAILNGPPELKEQAATGLGEVIKITSAEALQPSVVHITGPLIRILGDRFSWNVKASVLDTLALLLAKVGVKLKPFLPQLQTTFLKALNDPHRSVRLKAAAALSHLIVIHTRVDQLFSDLVNSVKTAEESSVRETMLQALRGIITPAGDKISENVRKQVMQTVLSMLWHPEDVTRTCAAGCAGAMCLWLPPDELAPVVQENFLQDDSSLDWTLRHGRSVALFVALKVAASKVLNNQWSDNVSKTILSYLTSDRIPIVQSGVRCMGYLVKYLLSVGNDVNQSSWMTFVKLMNHSSNEVKQLLAQIVTFLAKSAEKSLPNNLLKLVIPQLVNGTKEKNTIVKANSEYALVAILKLRQGDANVQNCLSLLDSGARESLNDVISKVLKRVATLPEPKDDELDDTLLI